MSTPGDGRTGTDDGEPAAPGASLPGAAHSSWGDQLPGGTAWPPRVSPTREHPQGSLLSFSSMEISTQLLKVSRPGWGDRGAAGTCPQQLSAWGHPSAPRGHKDAITQRDPAQGAGVDETPLWGSPVCRAPCPSPSQIAGRWEGQEEGELSPLPPGTPGMQRGCVASARCPSPLGDTGAANSTLGSP